MKYLIDGQQVPLSTAVGVIELACESAGVSLSDILPDGIAAAAQTEWGRELVNELSGYRVECIPTNTAERESFYMSRPAAS